MKKIPIELFGVGEEQVAARSPVVWNGLEFSLCSEIPYSMLSTLMRKVKELNLEVSYHLFKVNVVNHTNKAIIADLRSWYQGNEQTVAEIAQVAYGTQDMSGTMYTDAERVYASNEKLKNKLIDAMTVLKRIKDGTLLHAGGAYNVAFNKATYTYSLSRKIIPAPTFAGDSSIAITKTGNTVKIDFDPTMTFKIIAGFGTYTNTLEHYSTLNIANVIQGTRGISVKENRDNFTVSASETLIVAKNSNVKVNYDINTGFRIALDSAFKYSLNFRLYQGYGVEINYDASIGKYAVSVGNIAPRFVAGRNVTLTQLMANGQPTNTYEVKFNLPAMPEHPDIDAVWPVIATSQYVMQNGKRQLLHHLTVDPDYSTSVNEALQNINKSLVNSDTSMSNVTLDMITAEAKAWLKCPILNVFRIASTDTLDAGGLSMLPPEIAALVTAFGATSKTLDLPVDLLPLMSTDVLGNGVSINSSFSFNAFTVLEAYIRRRSGMASFSMAALDKGTRFKLVSANLDTAVITKRSAVDNLPLDYNMGWVETNLRASDGRQLAFSAADYDFFTGVARNGQLNASPIVWGTNVYDDALMGRLGFQIVSTTKTKTTQTVSYSVVIKSTYDSTTYTVVWRKPLNLVKSNNDNMTEISATSIPPFVRFIGRLVAEWGYTIPDVTQIFVLMVAAKTDVEAGRKPSYYNRLSDPAYISLAGFVEAEGYMEEVSINSITGDIVLSPKLYRGTLGNLVSTNSAFNGIRAMLTFRISPLIATDFASVDANCNWDFMAYNPDTSCSSISGTRTVEYLSDKPDLYKELTGTTK